MFAEGQRAELRGQKLCAHAGTCELVQLTSVRQRQQAVGGVLETLLHPHLTQRNSVLQHAASVPGPAPGHV